MAESWRIGRSATRPPSCTFTAVTSMVTPALQARGEPGADLEAQQSAPEERVLVALVLDDLGHDVDHRRAQALRRLGPVDLLGAVLAERGAELVGEVIPADDDDAGLAAELLREPGALGHGTERVLVELALVVECVGEDAHANSFLSSSQATIFSTVSFVSSSSMISPGLLRGRRVDGEDGGAGSLLTDLVGLDADVAGGALVELLLLGAHDRLERRVARLVDGVAHGDDRGQLHVHGVVAVLGLTLAAELAGLGVDLDHLGQRRHLQVVGHHGADRVALAVIRLLAEQHQVGRLGLEHLGQRVSGGAHVGAGQRVVGQVHRAVRAQRHGLVQRAEGGLGAHRHGHDLVDVHGTAFANLHRGFDGVGVERVQVLLAGAVDALGIRDPCASQRRRRGPLLRGRRSSRESFSFFVRSGLRGGCPQAAAIVPPPLTDESIAPLPRCGKPQTRGAGP